MRFDQPPPPPLSQALGYLLSWHGRRIAAKFAEGLAPLGLRPPHFGVMSILAARPGTAQQDLVEGSMIDASSMVKVIDELEELGLAERRVDAEDRRKRAVHLTARGKRTLDRARQVANAVADDVLGPLDAGERETLRLLLVKMSHGS